MPSKKVNLFVVDDHPIVAEGFSMVLSKNRKYNLCGSAINSVDAIKQIKKLKPDIVTMDISLHDGLNGLELLKKINKINSAIKTLVVSMHDERIYAERSLKAGACGYIKKSEFTGQIIDALEVVSNGGIFLSPGLKDEIIEDISSFKMKKEKVGIDRLTDREFEIFELIGKGLSTKQIAEKLGLSDKTVLSHKLRIKNKLNLNTANELLNLAIKSYNVK